jgi:2-polyprenyl-6-methoxyphenol hydroxylase-like FAD-dependent oxidoreductase
MPAEVPHPGMAASQGQGAPNPESQTVLDTMETACCVVGAGPAGAMLALLLARVGIGVVLLEEHTDFDRDFRGDTIHPSVMQDLREIGLDRRVLALPHTELHTLTVEAADGPLTLADFGLLKTPYPFITFMPQRAFLESITAEAARHPSFRLIMGARVEALVTEGDTVRGVRYRGPDSWHEVRALVTVGCDGRFSRLRRLGGFTPVTTSPPMDVLWFRVPRRTDDPPDVLGRIRNGRFVILLNRDSQWQVATVIPKGSYQQLRAAGIEALRAMVTDAVPEMTDRVDALTDWRQVSLLSVASDRLSRWYKPGLLLVGDAAHTMSPVGGVGINYAIQDAVVAANALYRPLRAGRVDVSDLAAVQRERELPTRIIQAAQAQAQRQVVQRVFRTTGALSVPRWVRLLMSLPGIRMFGPYLIGIGIRPAHVAPDLRTAQRTDGGAVTSRSA